MKYKSLLHLIYFAALLLACPSCKKHLDLKPSDGILREDYWKTKEQVRAAVIGCYGSLLSSPGGGGSLSELFFLWGELRADMLAPSLGTSPEEYEVMNVNTVPTNSITNWQPVYSTINYCNTVIKFAPLAMETDKTLTQEALDGYVAEAKTLRALLYFYLVRSFGDVPLKLTPTSTDDEIVPIAKSPQQDVLNQILTDLNDAEAKIALTYGNTASDKGRITRYAVNALQADVYLWMDNYAAALTACDKVIGSRRFGLVAGGSAWFSNLFRVGNSNESIFEFQFDAQKPNTFFDLFAINKKEFIAANRVMDQVYSTFDPNGFKDIRGDGAAVRATDNLIWKYIGNNDADMITSSAYSYTHWFVYRYADILLMKAEALTWLRRGPEALDLITQVRTRANALAATNNNPDTNNPDEMARFVLDERAREFMYEGKRWYDVLRYVKRNNYAQISYLQDMVADIVPANSVHTVQTKILDHNSHYFPIYFYELQTNKRLIQNPFYK